MTSRSADPGATSTTDYVHKVAATDAATRYASIGELRLENGQVLPDVRVAYRTWGTLNAAGDNAILVCHALTGTADVELWWPDMIGPGRALDPTRHFILCSNLLGGCAGTSGPLSAHPGGDGHYGARFPQVSIRDMVHAQARWLEQLGVGSLRLILGPSMGGMQALEWAALYPQRVRAIAPIGVAGRHSAWCSGFLATQRAAIAADPNWCDGRYSLTRPPSDGLRVARMLAMSCYRSWDNFQRRFGRTRTEAGEPQVAKYLDYQGRKLCGRFDAVSYVRLTQAMDSHDVARDRGAYEEVLGAIHQPALVVSIPSDVLYPPREQRELAALLPDARLVSLDSDDGHDGFLIHGAAVGALISEFERARLQPVAAAAAQPAPC